MVTHTWTIDVSVSCQKALQNSTLAVLTMWDILRERKSGSIIYLVLLNTDMAAWPIELVSKLKLPGTDGGVIGVVVDAAAVVVVALSSSPLVFGLPSLPILLELPPPIEKAS